MREPRDEGDGTAAEAGDDGVAPARRRPRQARGQDRVDGILDAAAATVAEGGISALTVQGVAKRAGATVGSLYHFFHDRDDVLRALAERHGVALRGIVEAHRAAAGSWAELPIGEAVERFLTPFLDYVERNPDLLPVARASELPDMAAIRDTELDRLVVELGERFVEARTPGVPADERRARAATLLGVVDGVLGRGARDPDPPQPVLVREVKRAVAAYLATYEEPGR